MANKKFPIEVGQEVVLEPLGNYVRWYKGKISKGRITKIARKYFYVGISSTETVKIELETFNGYDQNNNAGWAIWPT